jgi:hypothetical protein
MAGDDFSGDAVKAFGEAMYKAASERAPPVTDFDFPREYKGVYLDRRRESGFQLYNALGIRAATRRLQQADAGEFPLLRRTACGHHHQ